MKSKEILVVALLEVFVAIVGNNAFAADSSLTPDEVKRITDENKRVTDENARLKKALDDRMHNEVKSEDNNDTTSSNFWAAIGYKAWLTTFQPGDGTSRNAPVRMGAMTAGYENFFINWSWDTTVYYTNPNDSGNIQVGKDGFGIGYIPTPDLLVAISYKNAEVFWRNMPAPYSDVNPYAPPGSPPFITIGASYTHAFSDSPYSINGGVTLGQRTLITRPGYSGITGGSSTYLSYDVGGNYALTKAFKMNLFYRIEQWDTLAPADVYAKPVTIVMKQMMLGGPGAGISYSF